MGQTKITFLGTGTSAGIPVLTCGCEVCRSLDFRDKRLRSSVHIETAEASVIIDTGPDFRQQALREGIKTIDAVIFTHEHKDHTAGIDDLRPYNYQQGAKYINLYALPRVLEQIKQEYAYAFEEKKYPGIPLLNLHAIDEQLFSINSMPIEPINILHHHLPILGYRINDFSYVTDANFIADEVIEKLKGSKVLVLNALQRNPHISHFNLEEAIAMAQKIGAEKTYFTHISHKLGLHAAVSEELPDNIFLAYDGLVINL